MFSVKPSSASVEEHVRDLVKSDDFFCLRKWFWSQGWLPSSMTMHRMAGLGLKAQLSARSVQFRHSFLVEVSRDEYLSRDRQAGSAGNMPWLFGLQSLLGWVSKKIIYRTCSDMLTSVHCRGKPRSEGVHLVVLNAMCLSKLVLEA